MNTINVYVAGKVLAEILATENLPCRITPIKPGQDISPPPNSETVIILKRLPDKVIDGVKYVLCAREPLKLSANDLSLLYDVWPEPLTPGLLKYYFRKLIDRVRAERVKNSKHEAEEEYHRHLVEMASQDYLTGLATRWYLAEYFAENVDEGDDVTCVYMDMDNFKTVNDTYGHEAGDRALAATAEMMQNEFSDGFCARMGGDEFMIVLTGARTAESVADRVNAFMAGLLNYYAGTKTMKALSVSAGISQKSHDSDKDIDRLIHESDIALYAAKKSGRACCRVYSPDMEQDTDEPQSRNFYLVDYENVHSQGLDGIHNLSRDSTVAIFYSRNAASISLEANMNIRSSHAEITYHHVHTEPGTKNALDFQLSSYLGHLIATQGSGNHYYIVSQDTGFSPLIPFWREKNITLDVIPDISGYKTSELDELAQRVKVLTGNDALSRRIAEIITQCGTKIEVNTAIQRLCRNNKAGEIYRSIRPLIEDKPGQHRKVL